MLSETGPGTFLFSRPKTLYHVLHTLSLGAVSRRGLLEGAGPRIKLRH